MSFAIAQKFRSGLGRKDILFIVVLGFLIRLVFAPFTKDPWDMDVWVSVGSAINSGQNPYALSSKALVYPPFWGFICAIGYTLYVLSGNLFQLYFTLKLPIIVADVFISLVIGNAVYDLTNDAAKSRAAMILYLFNPVTIIFSSLWGMFDAIPALFALLSILYLSRGKYMESGLALGIGIGFKGFYPALLLPFLLFSIYKKERKINSCLRYIVYSLVIPVLISAPFLVMNSQAYTNSIFLSHTQRSPANMTYWFPLRLLLETTGLSAVFTNTLAFYVFMTLFFMLYLLIIKKASSWLVKENPSSLKFLLRCSILVLLAFFITSTVVNEQYLIWIAPLIIVYIIGYNQLLKLPFYILCTLNVFFVALNVGPRFFTPVIEMPIWWGNFQYSGICITLMILIGTLFCIVCVIAFLKLVKENAKMLPK